VLEATLCFLIREDGPRQVLLGLKKVGFGRGKYGGVGGKLDEDETPAHAAARELFEETGIVAKEADLKRQACLRFHFPHRSEWTQKVHAFTATSWVGAAREGREIVPVWFPVGEIPYDRMWDDCRYWLPRVLGGEEIDATFVFAADNGTVEAFDIRSWAGDWTDIEDTDGGDDGSTDHAVAR
jgi:8-oxo-dGTP diphosphatase